MIKHLWRKYGFNPFDSQLKKAKNAGHRRFLICWNRGLGDIPLGLYALTHRIRHFIPDAQVTFATRPDLADGFKMLNGVSTLIDPEWKRGTHFDLEKTLSKSGLSTSDFDVVLQSPDPTRWLMWQIGKLTPKLSWDLKWDALHERFAIDPSKKYIGVHVQTETSYAYEKNWPVAHWEEFFQAAGKRGLNVLLFGFSQNPIFAGENIIDLRGKTSLFEMLSLIKNRCRYLVVPDSGVLSITYYIDVPFEIDVISLWADPRQGVLRQKVASPNPLFSHRPLIATNKDLRTIPVQTVMDTLC